MLKTFVDFASAMLCLGWSILTFRSRKEVLPAVSDRAVRYIEWGTYAWTFGLTLLTGSVIFALLMLFAA